MNNNSKKILLISYHFPPSIAVGGLRCANFAKTLPYFGWKPYVLTINDSYLEKRDNQRLDGFENIDIYRTKLLPTILQGYLKLKSTYFNWLNRKPVEKKELESFDIHSNNSDVINENIVKKIKRYIISIFLGLPDMERNWVVPATLRAIRIIRQEKIDYIYTTCPPYSVHLIGLLIKKITGVKWIADFRDPWMTTGSKRTYPSCRLSVKIEQWLENKVINNSDVVTFNVERLKDEYKNKYNKQPPSKFVFIPNGLDPELISKYNALEKYDKFTISYTGSLYVGRTPEPVFKAIKKLAEEIDINKIKIKLVGSCNNIDGIPTSRLVTSYGLDNAVEILDTVPYSKALEIIKQSHIALLLAPTLQFQIPAKVYDYMGLGTKVLALTDEGATADFVNSNGIGKAFRSSDISGIMEFIYQSVHNQESLVFGRDALISKFSLKSITQRLVDHLNRI